MDLANKTILITGGSSGIGLELAKVLLEKGCIVLILGRDSNRLDEAEKLGLKALRCDVSKTKDVEDTVVYLQNHYPLIDGLINNAGVQYNYLFDEATHVLDRIKQEVEINLFGPLILTQLMIPLLATSSSPFIVNVTSALGASSKLDGLVYSATKAGLRNFTRGLRYSLINSSIQVYECIPPVTETSMTAGREGDKMPVKHWVKWMVSGLEKDQKLITLPKIRLFLWIAFRLPRLAFKMVSSKG
ncbi:SDR family NAD(P)-dependent oxidoreductase [bacterium SCSIO 12741]|nr:SDR family NAD(P)-dependent oxidoreductase [bacterium SCSIO 12741]